MDEEEEARKVIEQVESLPGFYDHEKVISLQNCFIDLAEACGANMLEFAYALRNVLVAVEVQMAKNSKEMGEEREARG